MLVKSANHILRHRSLGKPISKAVKTTGLFLVLLFSCIHVFSQEDIRITAFGHIPKTIPDSLYTSLKKAKTSNQRLRILYEIGEQHAKHGNADSVNFYSNKMSALIKGSNNLKDSLLHVLRSKKLAGDGKLIIGFNDEALKDYLDGITISDSLSVSSTEVFWLELGLGKVYLRKREYSSAKSIFEKCAQETDNDEVRANAYYLLGVLATLEYEDYDLSLSYYEKARSAANNPSMDKLILQIELNEGSIFLVRKKYDKALVHFEHVMKASIEKQYYGLYTNAVLYYGDAYSALGEFKTAQMVLSMAYANAINWNRLELQKSIIQGLRNVYVAQGDYENAYNLMTRYNAVSEEILENQNIKTIKDLEYKYNTLQKEKEIVELKKTQLAKQNEIERQKTIKKAVLYGFLVLLIPIITLLYVYYQKLQTQSLLAVKQQELNNRKITSLLNEQELKIARTALSAQQEERSRIAQQLHDSIGGNLAGIKLQLSNVEKPNDTQKGIMKQVNETYELVREISHNLIPKKFNENAFTILLNDYLDKIKNGSDLSIAFSAHPEEKINGLPETIKVELYQIIQELTTNTLKHANATSIELHLSFYNNTLQLLFEDDGTGFDMKKTHDGIGITNINTRIKQLHGNLVLDSTPGRGTAFTITIPIKDIDEKI
ncbi:histidine kinase [Maribacter sp. MMG018]|uniref:tetratricopeptide repeat-containing sensor histidine kinase n=1 Tax=Maribacter sp. MMG018 TaxID=2822688 RepID=UPI001B38F002|nr:ATP-binding protein [Maribacter sp. MMG018]MBQ4913673.1 histidine kinase [Maribacter sp. MMG018]